MGYKQKILQLSREIGLSYELMYAYDRVTGNLRGIHPDDRITSYRSSSSTQDQHILFQLIPGYSTFALRLCVLAHAFRMNGYQPVFLYNDNLPANPGTTNDSDKEWIARNRQRITAKQVPSKFGFETYAIGDLLTPDQTASIIGAQNSDELLSMTNYSDQTITQYAKASLRKYLKTYRLNLSDPSESTQYIQFLQSAIMILRACHEIIDRKSIISIIASEPNYIQGGIPLEVGKSAGIDVYTQGLGYHEGNLMFGRANNRDPNTQFCDTDLVRNAVGTRLSEAQREKIAEVMKQRQRNENTRVDYAVEDGHEYESDAPTKVGVFSHLLWDGALEPEEGTYQDFYQWLDDTISAGKKLSDVEFVLKAHPAEELRGTNEPVADWLNEHYDPLPNNFSFLPPDTDVNTYELFDQLDAGIVFASTVGLEMAYNGIPVVAGGFPPYHEHKITFTPDTTTEYKELVHDIAGLECSDEMQERATRFAYFLFECQSINFPYLSQFQNSSEDIVIEHDEIAKENSTYQQIVEQMLNGDEVLNRKCEIADTKD